MPCCRVVLDGERDAHLWAPADSPPPGGPWPADERWWSVRGRRRQARMQVVTVHTAHLLTRERGGWWLEATYD